MTAAMVNILCATYNGARFLPELLASIEAQTHRDWRLWIRDDGSSDETLSILAAAARRDDRIRISTDATGRLGAARSFGWLLEHASGDAPYVAFADQDDVWHADKLARMLRAMRATEMNGRTPVLVHSDLTVVDEQLRQVHPSFWSYAKIDPEPATLRRFVVRNPVTGAACMINSALRELAGAVPPEAVFHDWWLALVAVAFGNVVALRESTILYRQHHGNVVGAKDPRVGISQIAGTIRTGLGNTGRFRDGVVLTANQARALEARFGDRLAQNDRQFLLDYAAIPSRAFLRRKLDLARMRALPEHGMLQRIGILLRG